MLEKLKEEVCRANIKAVENTLVLEKAAHMAWITEAYEPKVKTAPQALLDKHYYRKHGVWTYYVQDTKCAFDLSFQAMKYTEKPRHKAFYVG